MSRACHGGVTLAKLPAFQFYPKDWLIDPELSRCSNGARGLLMDVLCIMFQTEPRGVLETNGEPWKLQEVARTVRGPYKENLSLLNELVKKGALGLTKSGALFSRRMVKDEERRQDDAKRQRNHRAPGHAPVTPVSHGQNDGLHTPRHGPVTGLSRRSSSSSSSSIQKPFTDPKKGWVNPDEQRRAATREALNSAFRKSTEVASDVLGDVPKKLTE